MLWFKKKKNTDEILKKINNKDLTKRYFYLVIGCFISAFAFNLFFLKYGIVCFGVSGLSIVLNEFGVNPSLFIFSASIFLLIVSFFLLGFEKTKIDIPIYDLYNFYIKYSSMFDFRNLLKHYEDRYPLLEEEKKLFNILISIPNEIEFSDIEIENCKNTKKIIDYIYRSEVLVSEE